MDAHIQYLCQMIHVFKNTASHVDSESMKHDDIDIRAAMKAVSHFNLGTALVFFISLALFLEVATTDAETGKGDWRDVCEWINSGDGMLAGGCQTKKDAIGAAKLYRLLSSPKTPNWILKAIFKCITRLRTEKGIRSNYVLYLECQAGKY